MGEITEFGFNFGSIEVTRTSIDKSSAIISIKTPKAKFSVRATKTGQIKFYDDQGNECELIVKSLSFVNEPLIHDKE